MSLPQTDAADAITELVDAVVDPLFGSRPDIDLAISQTQLKAVIRTALQIATDGNGVWTTEWPTEEGTYLFRCRLRSTRKTYRQQVMIVEAHKNHSGHINLSGGGIIILAQEWEGVWQPFVRELPDLDQVLAKPEVNG